MSSEVATTTAGLSRAISREVFYDDVRIPLSNVVGKINEGWSVAMTTIGFERGPATFGLLCQLAVELEDLIAQARASWAQPGERQLEDDAIIFRFGVARAQVQAIRALMYQMVPADERGAEAGAEGSLMRLAFAELRQSILRLAMDVHGPFCLSRSESRYWVEEYLDSFAETIQGGTSEIQRSIIGERLLGLPR